MVHLSVAVARFVEILFWAILQAAGVVAGGLLIGLVVLGIGFVFVRHLLRRGQRK